ncbi:hypothetical protein O181_083654 [Austropuccinia psidii MF-1]|uniref:Retrotransposon gag domain-containing protein n=1 Tax=Austropuccinia psidii MF-1 TaxID=1389203 RepID=A0A9Q3IM00_9BASI|nr:hypothetical protein [Austropuccinia psidii MF-1]
MPIQHSPPSRKTRSHARTQAFLTPTPRAPLDGTPEEGRVPRRSSSFSGVVGGFPGLSRTTLKGPGEDSEEEEENSVEEEGYDGNEGVPAPVGHPKSEPSLLANLQTDSSSEASRPPDFKTPSMKAPECFDGTQPFKARSFMQSCQLIFHNDTANLSQDRKKVLSSTSFLIGRSAKWIGPYISNLTNQDPNYLLNSWKLFESQLFTLFGEPNEIRKAEAELDYLRMKEGGNVSLYIADFSSLVSRIGDWGERALIHHSRKGFPSRILDQLASHSSRIDSLQDLMDIMLELDTRYHERQNEKSHHQEKKPEDSKSNSSHPQNSSSSSQKKKKNFQKRDKDHSSLLNKDLKLINSEQERRIKEGLSTYCGGKHSLESYVKRPQN